MKEKHAQNIEKIAPDQRDEIEQLVAGFTEMITGYGSSSAATAVKTDAKFLVNPFGKGKLERFWD
jgi:hypothetical protein